MAESIHLETEDDAWNLLRSLIDNDVSFQELPNLSLGNWAKIDVYIPASKYDSSITPNMMKGWVELQRSIYRVYSIAQGGKAEARSLSDREKENLELIVKVQSGSSDQAVDFQEILETMASTLVKNMGPDQTLIAIIVLILTVGGASVVKTWLANKKDVKLAEIESLKTREIIKAQAAALETIADVAGVEKERSVLLARAARSVPMIAGLEAEAEKGREALVKHVTKDDAVINGVFIKSEAGQSITSGTRVEATDARMDGIYKIRKVDTTVSTGFRVHLSDRTGKELVADVADVMTTLEDRQVIRDSEWSKVPVFLQVNAKVRRGEVVEAVIVRARAYDPSTDGEWG